MQDQVDVLTQLGVKAACLNSTLDWREAQAVEQAIFSGDAFQLCLALRRLPLDAQTQEILGVPIRKVVIPVAAGRNLAVLLEAAVRNTILQFRGIDSMQDFIERQQRMMLDEDV